MKKKKLVGRSLRILYLMLAGMVLAHIFYVFYFRAVGSFFMSFFNVFSVAFYIGLFVVFLNKKYLGVMIFLFTEVCAHAFFAAIVVGPGSGFDLFIICIVFSIFLVKNITLASRKVIYALYAFAFVTLISMQLAPSCFDLSMFRVYLTEDQTSFIFLVNAVLSFIMVLFLSIIFLDDVEKDKKILKRQNARLLELARVDSLTGLLNRRAMKQRLENAFYAKSNYGVEFVVAIMDIDNFKQINDEFGHSCGDQVIKKLASIVQRKIRETDYVCRWGGDEVLILLNKSSLDGAVSTMKRIYYQISNTKMKYEQETINITVTIGICSSKDYYLLQDIIVEADRRLYRGKRKGKNRIVCSSDD
jgi:diguanylate cyclase (GGDEF)-like protein